MSVQQANTKTNYAILLWMLPLLAIQILNGFYLPKISHIPWLFWLNDVFTFVLYPLAAYLGLKQIGVAPPLYGFKRPNALYAVEDGVFHALFIFLSLLVIWEIIFPVAQKFLPAAPTFLYLSVIPESGVMHWWVAIFFAAGAGIVESVLYLGLFKYLIDAYHLGRTGDVVFISLVPLIFALAHWEQGYPGVICAWLSQVVFSIAYLRLRYLPPIIWAHAGLDFVLFI